MNAVRKWLLPGLLVIVPGVIYRVGAELDHQHAGPNPAKICPRQWQPQHLLGVHIPGFGVL